MNFFLRIKKLFYNRRGLSLLFLILFISSASFFPLIARAGFFDVIGGIILAVPNLILFTGLGFFLLVSQVFVYLTGALLNWVISPEFISVSFTNPTGPNANPIIGVGLDITKSFVNLGLVVFLVYIAVAIALRLGETEAKKSLARLILVALLVNFGPLIIGLIVDASNIAMNYFLQGIGTGFSDNMSRLVPLGSTVVQKLFTLRAFTATGQLSLLASAIVYLVLYVALGMFFLLYAVLFLFRYVAIWTMVILSPLAFVAWILPATKGYWTQWRDQLIQWSTIGVVKAFFLYLSAKSLEVLPTVIKTQASTPLGPEVNGIFNTTFPYFVALAFIYLGFMISFNTTAMVARGIMSGIVGGAKGASGWAGKRIWRGASTWVQEKARVREGVGAITKKWEEKRIARWFIPEIVRKYAEMRPAIDEAQKKLSIHSSPEIAHRAAVGDIYGKDAVGGLMEVVERGDSNDWLKQHMLRYGIKLDDPDAVEKLSAIPEYRKKMARLLQIGVRGGRHAAILRGAPRLAEFAIDAEFPGYKDIPGNLAKSEPGFDKLPQDKKREKIRGAAIAMAVDEARTQHVKNWEREDLLDKAVVSKAMERGEDFQRAIFTQVKRGHGAVLETVAGLFKDFAGQTENKDKPIDLNLWKKFREDFKQKHEGKEGFFLYLESDRAKRQGWTEDVVIRMAKGEKPAAAAAAAAATPGAAAGAGPTPPGTGEAGAPPPSRKPLQPPRGRGGVGT